MAQTTSAGDDAPVPVRLEAFHQPEIGLRGAYHLAEIDLLRCHAKGNAA
jgi:hypothetical protein